MFNNPDTEEVSDNSYGKESDSLEDEELLLENSELHKYLKECQVGEINVYKSGVKIPAVPVITNKFSYRSVPEENFKLVKKILNSNLLLEEDASFLFSISTNFIPEKKTIKYSKPYIIGLLIVISITVLVYLQVKNSNELLLPVTTGLFCLCVYFMSQLYFSSRTENMLESLICVLRNTFLCLRKISRIIAEEDSILTSKENTLNLKRCKGLQIDIHNYKKNNSEVALHSLNTALVMKSLIEKSRNATLSFVSLCKSGEQKKDYIAFCTDEQLGISSLSELGVHHLSVLENFKNLYLLMQSECLCVLGLCLLQNFNVTELFNAISNYKVEIEIFLKILQSQYQSYFYPNFSVQKIGHSQSNKQHNFLFVNDLARSSHSLFIEFRKLEEYIENNNSNISLYVNSSLINLEKELLLLLESVRHQIENSSRNLADNNMPSKPIIETKNEELGPQATPVNVGFSDFSVSGIDEVFLGSTDNEKKEINIDNEAVSDFFEFKPPPTLINELKKVLVQKRNEFEQREIKTLKTPEELETYKSCLNTEDLCLNKANGHTNNLNKLDGIEDVTNIILPSSMFSLNPVEGNLQKNVALAASNLSLGWEKMKTVEYFEDDD